MVIIGNVNLSSPIMNASGIGTVTKDQILELDQYPVGAIVSKTCTYYPKEGNPEPNYIFLEDKSMNWVGMKNFGFDYYVNIRPKKPYIMSIYPDEEILSSSKILQPDLIEINMSCPNLSSELSFRDTLDMISKNLKRKFGIKIGLHQVEDVIRYKNPNIDFVTCCNTIPAIFHAGDDSDPDLYLKCGVGGKSIKPYSLYAVHRLSKFTRYPIIGCGGITCKDDVEEYLRFGAKAVQIGSYFFQHGCQVFDEFKDYAQNHDYGRDYEQIPIYSDIYSTICEKFEIDE